MLQIISSTTTRALQFFQAARFGTTLIISILLVRSISSQVAVAHYEQWIFLGNLLSFFWAMGLSKAALSYYPSIGSEKASKFYSSASILLIFLGGVMAILGLTLATYLQSWLGLIDFPYWNEAMLLVLLSVPISMIETRFTLEKKSKQIVFYGIISFSTILLAALLAFLVYHDLYLFIQIYLIWMGLRWIYLIWLNWGSLDFALVKEFSLYSIPLILHIILGNGMEYVDGIIVNHYFDTETFPVFRYGARELPISSIFVSGIVTALIPLYHNDKANTLKQIKLSIKNLIRWMFPAAMLIMLISPLIYGWVYGERFVTSAFLFNIYLLILISRILLPQVIIQASHNNQILVYSAVIELLVNIGLSLILLSYFGLAGIAAATWMAFLLNKVILIAYVKHKMKIPLSSYLDQKSYLFYSLCLLLAFLGSYFIYQ